MSGLKGYMMYVIIFVLFFASLASIGLYDIPAFSSMMSTISESQFTGAAITGAVTAIVQEPAEKKPLPLINWAILLVSLSFVFSLMTARSVHKRSRYRA